MQVAGKVVVGKDGMEYLHVFDTGLYCPLTTMDKSVMVPSAPCCLTRQLSYSLPCLLPLLQRHLLGTFLDFAQDLFRIFSGSSQYFFDTSYSP